LGSARYAAGIAAVLGAGLACAQTPARAPGFADALLGRWNLAIQGSDGEYPSWLEVRLRTEAELAGRFVGRFGSVRHVASIDFDTGALLFEVPVQYERQAEPLRFEGVLENGALTGTTRGADGAALEWAGTRAPPLPADDSAAEGAPIMLFNGRDLAGWRPRSDNRTGCWHVAAGELVVTPPCVDLISTQTFGDFSLHAEFNYPAGSNSGLYLRGRYELQIQDDAGKALDPLRIGGVYGFLAPAVDAAHAAGEWQTLDVTLLGRRVTVVLNGTTIIDGQEIPGITGGALDSRENLPGPIMLQGDHGPIRFRSLTLTPRR
jgi:hypothetical protein